MHMNTALDTKKKSTLDCSVSVYFSQTVTLFDEQAKHINLYVVMVYAIVECLLLIRVYNIFDFGNYFMSKTIQC